MTKREQYGLIFDKMQVEGFGIRDFIRQRNPGGSNGILIYIGRLDEEETKAFINDMNQSLNLGRNYDDGFLTDSVEHLTITYEYPNVKWDNILTISMIDLRDLLIEWLDFITKK